MYDIKALEDNTGLLVTEDVLTTGINKTAYYNLIQKNGYEKVAHGVYASPDCFEDELYILSLRCPSGIISHDDALFLHGLTDRTPLKHTITVYSGYGTARLKKAGIKVYTVKKELLEIGRTMAQTNFGHTVPMYDLERTICDMVRSRSNIEIQDFQAALKSYVRRKDKDLNKLYQYAKLFHIDKVIREYLGVLL